MIGMMEPGMKIMMVIAVVVAIGVAVAATRWLKRR